MKRWLFLLLLVGLLSGCGDSQKGIDKALSLRSTLLQGNGCTFDTVITADYGEELYTFTMKNTADSQGNLRFEVVSPDSIAGICGEITGGKGTLTFDDKILAFSMMADDQITPVSAPWLLIKTLRGGYINACEDTDTGLHVQIDDSYQSNSMHLDIWTDLNNFPVRGEIFFDGRRIITLVVENFTFM